MMVPTMLFKSVRSSSHEQSVPICMNKPVNNTVEAGHLNHVQACQQAKTSCEFLRVYCMCTSKSIPPSFYRLPRVGRPKFRRSRTIFNSEQLDILEQHFAKYKYPDIKRRRAIAEEVGLPEERVQVWFQNRRAKNKRQTDQDVKLQELVDQAISTNAGNEQRFQSNSDNGNYKGVFTWRRTSFLGRANPTKRAGFHLAFTWEKPALLPEKPALLPGLARLAESPGLTTFIVPRNPESDICVQVFILYHTHKQTELVR